MKIINNPQNINTTNYEELKQKDEIKTKILKFLTYKKRTEQEVRNKFKQEVNEDILEEIIEYLKEAKYIDDKEFIQKQVNEYKTLKTMSIKEIKYKFLEKCLNKKLIDQYVEDNKEELEEYEKKCIEKIRNKKIKTMDEDKVNQYLYRKGYNIGRF